MLRIQNGTLMATIAVLLKFFGLAFSALLPIVNPLGSALLFLELLGNVPDALQRNLARKVAINTTLFLTLVEISGAAVLAFFGISLPVMQIAGGLVLASMGWGLLNQEVAKARPAANDITQTDPKSLQEKTFYPFTFPITVGPGTVVVLVTLSAHVPSKRVFADVMAHLGILAAIVALSLIVFVCYRYAGRIRKHISPQNAQGILRVTAFVLLCIGAQITWNGLESLLRDVLKSQ